MDRFIGSLVIVLFLAVCTYFFSVWVERRKAAMERSSKAALQQATRRGDVHRTTDVAADQRKEATRPIDTEVVIPFKKPGTIFIIRPHTSYLDGPAVARWLTRERGIKGAVFAVDPDFAQHPFWRFVLNAYGRWVGGHTMVALDSSRPFALRKLLAVLHNGGHVVIFPQGTGLRSGKKRPDQPGFLWMMAKTQAQTIACHLRHSKKWPIVESPRYSSQESKHANVKNLHS